MLKLLSITYLLLSWILHIPPFILTKQIYLIVHWENVINQVKNSFYSPHIFRCACNDVYILFLLVQRSQFLSTTSWIIYATAHLLLASQVFCSEVTSSLQIYSIYSIFNKPKINHQNPFLNLTSASSWLTLGFQQDISSSLYLLSPLPIFVHYLTQSNSDEHLLSVYYVENTKDFL